MTPSATAFPARFVAALFDPQQTACGLAAQPAFAVYRNTVIGGCIDALEANFPSVARLVGTEWFRAAAADYVRAQPPRDARLLQYGQSFPAFLAGFEPARALAYLPGVARLDRLWIEAHTAADAECADPGWLARLPPEQLGAAVLQPHPAARWCPVDAAPILSIWAANRLGHDPGDTLDWRPEGALLTRPIDAVQWQPLDAAGGAFLDACAAGCTLALAAGAALQADPEADLAGLLSGLLSAGALSRPSPDSAGAPA